MAAKILKAICICLSVLAVLLCGCAKKSAPPAEPVPNFQADFTADYRGMQLCGQVTAARQDVYTLRFTEPPTLEGLQLRRQNGVLSLRRGDALATADEPYLPGESFPTLLFDLLQAVLRGEMTAADGAFTLSLPCGEATVTLDESRLPQSASIPDADCALRFFNGASLE